MIPEDFKQTLLNRIDIVEVIERHLPLKKAGQNFVACCPFHSEKTPSFSVSPSKQFYHCFGCGAHGNAIGFLIEYSAMGYVDAVKELAAGVGMQVPQLQARELKANASRTEPADHSEDLGEVLLRAARYYKDKLKETPAAIAYLKQRGLTGETASRFGIGYAPEAWQNLAAVFSDYRSAALLEAGLVVDNDQGKRYDRFRGRIVFPILNARGSIIGFGGRILESDEPFDKSQDGPKYLNSPETPLFEKGQELYGLFQARQALRAAGRVLVVEGYMDVVSLAQHGIGYSVATLGTSTTPTHVQKLLRQTDEVVFCFDGDDAGRRAAWRALENSLGHLTDSKHVSFLFLPQGEDPDSFVRTQGKPAFEQQLAQALPLSAFLLRELTARVDMKSEEGRAQLLHLAKPLITRVTAPALGLMLRKRLAELAGVATAEMDELFGIKRVQTSPAVRMTKRRSVLTSSEILLRAVVFDPAHAASIDQDILDQADLATPLLLEVLDLIGSNPNLTARNVVGIALDRFRDTVNSVRIQDAVTNTLWDDTFDVHAEFAGALEGLRKRCANLRIDELRTKPLKELSADEKLELQRLLTERHPAAAKSVSESATSV